MPTLKRYLLFCLIVSCCSSAVAQQIPLSQLQVKALSSKDGVLANGYYTAFKDSKGFMWFCTDFLQRYDGHRFKTYYTKEAGYIFTNIIEDRQNVLWTHSIDGTIFKYNALQDVFMVFIDSVDVQGIKMPIKGRVILSANGDVWVFNLPHYAVRYISGSKTRQLVTALQPFMPIIAPNAWLEQDVGGMIYFSNEKAGVIKIDLNTGQLFSKENNPDKSILLTKNFGTARLIKENNNIWIQQWKDGHPARNLIRYDLKTNEQKTYFFPYKNRNVYDSANTWVDNLLMDAKGELWLRLGENVGIARYNKYADNFEIEYATPNNINGFTASVALGGSSTWLRNTTDDIFFTSNGGRCVQYFSPYLQHSRQIYNKEIITSLSPAKSEYFETILTKAPRGFVEGADGTFYAVLSGYGLIKFSNNFSVYKKVELPSAISPFLLAPFSPDGVNIYLFDEHGKLVHYNGGTQQAAIIPTPGNNRFGYRYYIEANKESVWLSHMDDEGISNYNFKSKRYQFYPIRFLPTGNGITNTSSIYDIKPEGDRYLWLAVQYRGIQLYDKQTGTIIKQFCHTNIPGVDYRNNYRHIEKYGNDTLILSGTHGIVVYNQRNGKWTLLNSANGLPDVQIENTVVDKDHNFVWVNTHQGGLCILDMRTLHVTKLSDPETNSFLFGGAAYLKTKANEILFSAANGFTITKPTETFIKQPNSVQVTGILVNGIDYPVDSILSLAGGVVTLPEKNSQIEIQFSALDYWNSKSIEYSAWLKGADTGWISYGNSALIDLRYLKAGTYTLLLKCRLYGTLESDTTSAITIVITPPFVRSNLFRLAALLLSGILIYLFVKWRSGISRKIQGLKNEQLQGQLEQEKVINFFANDLVNQYTEQDVMWSVARNLVGKLWLEDCMLYMWNDDKTKMIQIAGYGPKGSLEMIAKQPFDVSPGQGVVGHVMQQMQPVLIGDTTKDSRYREDEMQRFSEVCAPIIYENELLGIIDSEHSRKHYFTQRHLQMLVTIASLMANKLHAIRVQRNLQDQILLVQNTHAQLTLAKLQALQSQMNPHFIFNSLNSIDNYILKNDKRMASDYLTKFAKLIRSILEGSRSELVPISKDITALEWYIELEQMRFKNKFVFIKRIEDEVLANDWKVPPMLLQPFAENAILHGLAHSKAENLKLELRIFSEDGYLIYQIADNGVGRRAAEEIASSRNKKSSGIEVTTQRIKLHNGTAEQKEYVVIEDLITTTKEATGTRVTIYLKINV